LPAGALSGEVKRQRRSKAERLRIVEETLVPGASVARVAMAHQVNTNQVHTWRKLYQQGLLHENDHGSAPAALLPVRVARPAEAARLPKGSAAPRLGIIRVELPRASVSIEGEADPRAIRTALESLAR